MSARVVITAGGNGIGLAMAQAFAANGAQVWVTDANAAAISALPEGIRGSVVNAADEAQMATFFAEVQQAWGGLDTLCANAGIKGPTALIEDVDLSEWRDCFAVNVEGAFLATKYAIPLMKPQGAGAIIYTSSTAGMYGYPLRAPYSAGKWALHGLMKTVAMELGPHGIRANVIMPGAVEGPRMEAVLAAEATQKGMTRDQVYNGYAAGTSMRSFVQAQDIAAMAVFLVSDGARRVSGQMIAVDGHTENPDPKV